jgi:UDP-N-acetylmuramoyl-tripeptide--D-alanyl-D-alanine ligase
VIPATVDEIAIALGAQLVGPGDKAAVVTALTADSRTVMPGALFVALPGERVDGHDYVAAAAAAGAAASLTRHPVEEALCVVVVRSAGGARPTVALPPRRSSAEGFRSSASPVRSGRPRPRICWRSCSSSRPYRARRGNLNNELGVPLTVGRIDARTRFLVRGDGCARGRPHRVSL